MFYSQEKKEALRDKLDPEKQVKYFPLATLLNITEATSSPLNTKRRGQKRPQGWTCKETV